MYIEFKLFNGKVPYFVKDYFGYEINSKYYGVTIDDETCYLPETVIRLTEVQFRDILLQAKMMKLVNASDPTSSMVELTPAEKAVEADNWISKNKSIDPVSDTDMGTVKADYLQAITDLQTIISYTSPTNAQVVWAVKRMAGIMTEELKFLKRMINTV